MCFPNGRAKLHGVGRSADSIAYARSTHVSLLESILPGSIIRAANRVELVTAAPDSVIAFVDLDLLNNADTELDLGIPVVALLDCKPGKVLAQTVRALERFPWLSHVVVASALATSSGASHIRDLLHGIGGRDPAAVKGAIGRTALVASASRRHHRFARMRQFFSKHGINDRTNDLVNEIAEELVTNALYDAPKEAGYLTTARPRDENVELPSELACEISYWLEGPTIFLRVRDPFGALSRHRMMGVLSRCNAGSVELDESRGGAGLGLWRIFSAASTISITVAAGSLTEIIVEIRTKDGRAASKHLCAVHFWFDDQRLARHDEHGLIDQSVTLIRVA